jgi:hypothetical protein
MHADKVIHLQQLSIKWDPPRDPFFSFLSESNAVAGGESSYKGADSVTQGNNSLMNQNNTSIIGSQGNNNAQAQSQSELNDDQSQGTKNDNTTREKYERMKNVFRFLITEAPYLIDDKAIERCMDATPKDALKFKIDSVRKSIGIEDMADVELLVDVMYRYQDQFEKKLEEERLKMEELEKEEEEQVGGTGLGADVGAAVASSTNDPKKVGNDGTLNGGAAEG